MTKMEAYVAVKPVVDIFEEPMVTNHISRRESQLLLGEIFQVEARVGRFFKGRSRLDGYKGYVCYTDIYPAEGRATHFVESNLSIIRSGPDIKTRDMMTVSLMSRLEIEKGSLKNGFVRACGLGWIPEEHVKPLSSLKERIDHVEQALRFLGTPYRYGGRSALGIDCSGLTQMALTRSGFTHIPRDADMQEKSDRLGTKVPFEWAIKGDIVFFPAHVGIMIDNKHIISATEKYSAVVIETLEELAERQGGVRTVRRPVVA